MSGEGRPTPPPRPAEERAEELVGSAVRTVRSWVGRAREELEDMVAEARALERSGEQRAADRGSG